MVPYEFSAERFSRWMAYVLRHNPSRYGLEPDQHGYVDLDTFMAIAKRRYPAVAPEDLHRLIEEGGGRFEIAEGRLRARYGHSIPVEPPGSPVTPPPALYHGTDAARLESSLERGLQPQDRRMLHLSDTVEDAVAVARRKTEQPVVLRIMAQDAARAGLMFYQEGKVYLVSQIPPQFLQVESVPTPLADSSASGGDAPPSS